MIYGYMPWVIDLRRAKPAPGERPAVADPARMPAGADALSRVLRLAPVVHPRHSGRTRIKRAPARGRLGCPRIARRSTAPAAFCPEREAFRRYDASASSRCLRTNGAPGRLPCCKGRGLQAARCCVRVKLVCSPSAGTVPPSRGAPIPDRPRFDREPRSRHSRLGVWRAPGSAESLDGKVEQTCDLDRITLLEQKDDGRLIASPQSRNRLRGILPEDAFLQDGNVRQRASEQRSRSSSCKQRATTR